MIIIDMGIYFLRHIKTEDNLVGKISGRSESPTLPAQKLNITCKIEKRFDQIYCSPYNRCRETIALLPSELQCNVCFTPTLIERGLGILEGMDRKDAIHQFPQMFENGKLKVDAQISGIESIEEAQHRLKILLDVLKSNRYKQVLICSHNQTLKILLAELKGILITNYYWQTVNFKNGELVCIDTFSK